MQKGKILVEHQGMPLRGIFLVEHQGMPLRAKIQTEGGQVFEMLLMVLEAQVVADLSCSFFEIQSWGKCTCLVCFVVCLS